MIMMMIIIIIIIIMKLNIFHNNNNNNNYYYYEIYLTNFITLPKLFIIIIINTIFLFYAVF